MTILLLDLDGTLTDTAHQKFKGMKDGKEETILTEIPVFPGALEFVNSMKSKGYELIIVSDSHPRYVEPIANKLFELENINLCDKPNIQKVRNYLYDRHLDTVGHPNIDIDKDDFLMIGDSWLDIELGRRLNIRTVLTKFYKASSVEERDGIGEDWKPIKMGPTYYAKTFDELGDIIENPLSNLLAIESIFQGHDSPRAVDFKFQKYSNGFLAFRCLGRQNDGECDKYARADKYYQIDNPNRTQDFLLQLSKATENYLNNVLSFKNYQWDIFTYLTDKSTTTPANKMKEIFDLVNIETKKIQIFDWNKDIDGSLRSRPDYKSRREFISKNLFIRDGIDVKGKNIIVLDDQFTSSATAYEVSTQLRNKGAKNILFVALFYLILPIESKTCPNIINGQVCGKPLKIKIRKSDGNKFYSCLSSKYGGNGCGYTENIT